MRRFAATPIARLIAQAAEHASLRAGSSRGSFRAGAQIGAVLLFFSLFAYFIAPFTFGGKTVIVPPGSDSDAILATLLIAGGSDKLLSDPAAFYDTSILYPDRTQLRSTEPFIGFVLLALPLRALLRLSDADVFEVLRWLLVFAALSYAFLFYKAIGLMTTMSVAGAVLGWSHRWLVEDIERLQVVSIPLIFAALYYGVMVWNSRRPRIGHRVGLFVSSALYPLCGAINATIAAVAGLLVLPWILKSLIHVARRRRLAVCVFPIALAAVVDAAVLAPWLFDRADLTVYLAEAFLQIKHWNSTRLPLRLQDMSLYFEGMVGRGMGAALLVLLVLAVTRRVRVLTRGRAAQGPGIRMPGTYFWPLLASVALVAAGLRLQAGELAALFLGLLFHVLCWGTLAVYWRQMLSSTLDERDITEPALMLSFGIGTFLCLMSFGPVYSSNPNAFASHIVRVLLDVISPLKLIREYQRLWVVGIMVLSVYVTIRLGVAMRPHGRLVRASAAAIVIIATLSSIYNRELVASAVIEAPRAIVQAMSHSRAAGGVYVHAEMDWNSRAGVFMVAIARETGRPFVNGYLGVMPPWYGYARNVLHRFPDPEALWLLRKWNVNTVVSLPGTIAAEPPASVDMVFEHGGINVWEIARAGSNVEHPSRSDDTVWAKAARVEAAWFRADHAGGRAIVVRIPERFHVKAVEFQFGPSLVHLIPAEIRLNAFDGTAGATINRGRAGEWMESLAADALLRRTSPVATIPVIATESRDFLVEFRPSQPPLIERIILLGNWNG
jgi:hypothetical protein